MATIEEEYEAYKSRRQSNESQSAIQDEYIKFKERRSIQENYAASTDEPESPSSRLPIGSIVGGVAGSVIGAPGGLGTAIGLGTLGSAGGEAIQQVIEQATGSSQAPQTATEAAKRIGTEAAYGLASDVGGRAVIGGMKAGLRTVAPNLNLGLVPTVTPEARTAEKVMRAAGMTEQTLTPGQATLNPILDTFDALAESSIGGRGRILNFKANQQKILEQAADNLANKVTSGQQVDRDAFGRLFIQAVEHNLELARAPAKALYQHIDQAAKPIPRQITVFDRIPTGLVDEGGKPLYREVSRQETILEGGAMVKLLQEKEFAKPLSEQGRRLGIEGLHAGDDIVNTFQKLPNQISYGDAQELRSRLIAKREELSVNAAANAPALGKIKKFIGMLSEDIRSGLNDFDPRLAQSFDEADRIYKTASQTFNNRLIQQLVKKGLDERMGNPEAIAAAIFQKGAVRRIERVRNALDPETWEKLQQYAGHTLIRQSEVNGVLNGKALANTLTGRSGYGEETLQAMFRDKPDLVQRWKDLSTALRTVQERPEGTPGSMLVQMKQGGAFIQAAGVGIGIATMSYSGEWPWEATGIIVAPIALAHAMTNPTVSRAIIHGVLTPLGSPTAGAIYGRIAGFMGLPRRPEPSATVQPAVTSPSLSDIYQAPRAFQPQP